MTAPDRFTLAVDPLPAKPGEPPPAIRLRAWLKLGRRVFGLRVRWAEEPEASRLIVEDTITPARPEAGEGPPQ